MTVGRSYNQFFNPFNFSTNGFKQYLRRNFALETSEKTGKIRHEVYRFAGDSSNPAARHNRFLHGVRDFFLRLLSCSGRVDCVVRREKIRFVYFDSQCGYLAVGKRIGGTKFSSFSDTVLECFDKTRIFYNRFGTSNPAEGILCLSKKFGADGFFDRRGEPARVL